MAAGMLIAGLGIFVALMGCAVPAPAQTGSVLLVSYSAERKVAALDATTGRLLALMPTPKGPHEITISRDGAFAYVADSGAGPGSPPGDSIVVLDLKTRTVKNVFPACDRPHDTRISSDGKLLWVACGPEKAIVEMDARTGKILRKIDLGLDGGWFVETTPDEQKFYVPHLEGKALTVTRRASGESRAVYSGSTQFGVAVSPDGREIWASDSDEARLIIVETKGDTVVGSVDLPAPTARADGQRASAFSRLRFTPDGGSVMVVLGPRFILVNAKTRTIQWSVEMPYPGKVLTVSGDGRRAFVSHPGNDSVSVIGLAGQKVVGKFATGKQPDGVAWVK